MISSAPPNGPEHRQTGVIGVRRWGRHSRAAREAPRRRRRATAGAVCEDVGSVVDDSCRDAPQVRGTPTTLRGDSAFAAVAPQPIRHGHEHDERDQPQRRDAERFGNSSDRTQKERRRRDEERDAHAPQVPPEPRRALEVLPPGSSGDRPRPPTVRRCRTSRAEMTKPRSPAGTDEREHEARQSRARTPPPSRRAPPGAIRADGGRTVSERRDDEIGRHQTRGDVDRRARARPPSRHR